ncbi:MAG TPA: hypothetical protein VKN99_28170 [Polyangia bacterium]|nr:hypothetical protein [Polyangia bacterium]
MKWIGLGLIAAGCAGGLHLYDKAGSYTGRAFEKQAERREVPPPRTLSGTDTQLIMQNYAATFGRGGAAAGTASPAATAAGGAAGAGMAAETGGPGGSEATAPGR